jgi:hypothetical protein
MLQLESGSLFGRLLLSVRCKTVQQSAESQAYLENSIQHVNYLYF